MTRHKVGIVGLGAVGSRFIELFHDHDRFELVSGWDRSEGARSRAAAGGLAIAEEAQGVVTDPDVDVVYIAVPPLGHGSLVEMAVEAGKAIFCEKPLGVDEMQSRELVEVVERSGLPAAVNFVYGSAPAAERVLAAIADGEVGRLLSIDIRLRFQEWPRQWQQDALWLGESAQGGWVREVLSHFVFLAGRLAGPLDLQLSHIQYPDEPANGAEITASAEMSGTGVPVTAVGMTGVEGPELVECIVRGRNQSFRITDWYRLQSTPRSDLGGAVWADEFADLDNLGPRAYRAQLDNLALLLDGGPHRLPTFGEAFAVQEIIEAVLRS